MGRYQKGKTSLDFTEARDSEWQWHQLGHMQVCISLQTDNHASTPPLSFFTGQMPFLPPNQQHQSTEGSLNIISKKKQVCVEPPPPVLNVTLPAFAAERRLLQHSARSYRLISAVDAGAQQQTCQLQLLLSIDGTDRQMPSRCVDPAQHTMLAVSKMMNVFYIGAGPKQGDRGEDKSRLRRTI